MCFENKCALILGIYQFPKWGAHSQSECKSSWRQPDVSVLEICLWVLCDHTDSCILCMSCWIHWKKQYVTYFWFYVNSLWLLVWKSDSELSEYEKCFERNGEYFIGVCVCVYLSVWVHVWESTEGLDVGGVRPCPLVVR